MDYQECDLSPVQTAGGPVKPPGVGTVQLKVVKTDGSTMELTLYDVTYMPWCPINLLGVGKLMKQGGYAKPGKVIYVKNGKEVELCALD